jgi:N-acetylmuramoyl-L-alanine amidase
MALVWVYPKESDVVFEASSFVLGSASLDVDEITINNIPVVCQHHENEQAFAVPISLKPGNNTITLRANTGESITREIKRVAPLTLTSDAPLRPLSPTINTPYSLLIGETLEVEVLAHNSIHTLWLELHTEEGELLLQSPMVLKASQPLAPYQEFHARSIGIFGELHVNTYCPPLSLETKLFNTRVLLNELYLNPIQDGETLYLSYRVNHENSEDDATSVEESEPLSLDQRITLWRYPRHMCISEESTALYLGVNTNARRLAVLPPLGTPFPVVGKMGTNAFRIQTPLATGQQNLLLMGGEDDERIGQQATEIIQVAQSVSKENTHTLKLLANAKFGLSLYPHDGGIHIQLHEAMLGMGSVKQQHLSTQHDGLGHWCFPLTNPQMLEWKANTSHGFKGVSSEWQGSTLHLHAHCLPQHWEDLVVVLDAGHGGEEHGTHALNGLPEKEFNLIMALKLKAILKELGLKHVYLTRENDIQLSLEDRQRYALQHHADICLSLHANALPDGRNPLKHQGVSIHTYTPWSTQLGDTLQQHITRDAERPNDARYISNFAMTRLSTCQSALIEYGYFIHPEEYATLLQEATQHRLAWATAHALKAHHTRAFDILPL